MRGRAFLTDAIARIQVPALRRNNAERQIRGRQTVDVLGLCIAISDFPSPGKRGRLGHDGRSVGILLSPWPKGGASHTLFACNVVSNVTYLRIRTGPAHPSTVGPISTERYTASWAGTGSVAQIRHPAWALHQEQFQ